MNTRFLFVLLFVPFFAISQQLTFTYDAAGNQVKREITFNAGRISKPSDKEIAKLTEQDLLKFSPLENLSYYPNPVSEELYIKWEALTDNKVVDIQVSSLSGQVLKSFSNIENGSQIIPFESFSAGIYFVNLSYLNGERKTIKIIKK